MNDPVGTPPGARLRFRLIGTWHPVLLGELSGAALIRSFVADIAGHRDEDAVIRARTRRELEAVVTSAVDGGADAMFVATEISGSPLAATLIVQTPEQLRMAPAIGTAPDEVLRVLGESLGELGREGIETATTVVTRDTAALRVHRIREEKIEDDGVSYTSRVLVAEYWYAVPGSKRLVLATFITPMGDIPNVMLTFFDAIVRASSFDSSDSGAEIAS